MANALNINHTELLVPSTLVFFIFTAVFTMLVTVPYTILAPRFFPVLAHPFAMLTAEATTCLLWLSGFAAMADLMRRSTICAIGACAAARGSIVVGVFELYVHPFELPFAAFAHPPLPLNQSGTDLTPAFTTTSILFATTTFFAVSHVCCGDRRGGTNAHKMTTMIPQPEAEAPRTWTGAEVV